MKRAFLRGWSLRAQLAGMLGVAGLVPVLFLMALNYHTEREQRLASLGQLLAARADKLANELDTRNEGYSNLVTRIARFPDVMELCARNGGLDAEAESRLAVVLRNVRASDRNVIGSSIVGADGIVLGSTLPESIGRSLADRPHVIAALAGQHSITGVYLSKLYSVQVPVVTYSSPVDPRAGVRCAATLVVRAESLWGTVMHAEREAGDGSYGLVTDASGIRIAHGRSAEARYRPSGALPPQVTALNIAQQRFGERTASYLNQLLPHPEVYSRAIALQPDPGVVLSHSPVSEGLVYSVARRLNTVHWTVFYVAPASQLAADLERAAYGQAALGTAVLAFVLAMGLWFSASILRTVRGLGEAADALASGTPGARVKVENPDELGQLAGRFNAMAERIEIQSTDLRHAQLELEQRVAERTGLLQAVMNNSSAIVFALDTQGRFLVANDRCCALMERPVDQVLGRLAGDLLPEPWLGLAQPLPAGAGADGPPQMEEVALAERGHEHSFLVVRCALRHSQGEPLGMACIATDISERKQALASQLDQLARLKVLDEITTAIGERHDLHSIFQEVLASLKARMGLAVCAILGWEPPDDALCVVSVTPGAEPLFLAIDMPLQGEVPAGCRELVRYTAGKFTYVPDTAAHGLPVDMPREVYAAHVSSLVLAPLQSEGEIFGWLLVASRTAHAFNEDQCEFLRQLAENVGLAARHANLVEKLRRTNQQLRQSQQAAMQQERLRALGQMASGIAHDINNAISPVSLYAENLLLREEALSPDGRRQLEVISRAIDDVAATVARMREFYRPAEEDVTMRPVDLNAVVRQVVDLTRARWSDMAQLRGGGVDLQLDLQDPLPQVAGVEGELREALTNLVFNAVDAMPEGGRLTLRTVATARSGTVDLMVCDTGTGMDATTRARCLEPFFTTKGDRGTGLGLAMVYGALQRHGASISVESEPGAGATFTLRFPQRSGSLAPEQSREPRPVTALRVLVVDDDPLLLESLRDTLASDGHAVSTAEGGQAGIDAARTAAEMGQPFDVVITDLGMPLVDGRKVAQAVKAAAPATRVVLLTGWGRQLETGGDRAGSVIDQVLAKPPKLRALRAALAGLTHEEHGDE